MSREEVISEVLAIIDAHAIELSRASVTQYEKGNKEAGLRLSHWAQGAFSTYYKISDTFMK